MTLLKIPVTQPDLFGEESTIWQQLERPVLTAREGENKLLFKDICRLYIPPGGRILDMTYGKGSFWTWGMAERYRLLRMDLSRPKVDVRADLQALPFRAKAFDAAVLDPPYAGNRGVKQSLALQYNLQPTGQLDVLALYRAGILEAARVVRRRGILVVKCQDASQDWHHMTIRLLAEQAGFRLRDLFILLQRGTPAMRHKVQHTARKNHSYFLVFRH